jgi:hypothetical protein
MAGDYGCIALSWYNAAADRYEMRCAVTGNPDAPGALKAHQWYQLNEAGEFIECDGAEASS